MEYCANYEIIYSSDDMMVLIVENTYKEPYLIVMNGISRYISLVHKDMKIANKIARIRIDKAEHFNIENAKDVVDTNKLKNLPYFDFKDFNFSSWILNDEEKNKIDNILKEKWKLILMLYNENTKFHTEIDDRYHISINTIKPNYLKLK